MLDNSPLLNYDYAFSFLWGEWMLSLSQNLIWFFAVPLCASKPHPCACIQAQWVKLVGIFADLSHISTMLLTQKDAKELEVHLPSPET